MPSNAARSASRTPKDAYREVQIDRPNEDDNTPALLQAFGHPIRAQCPKLPPGRTLIFLLPTTDDGRKDRSEEEAKLSLPGKHEDTLIDAGFLKLGVGDLILGRSAEVSTEPVYRDDGILGWVGGGSQFTPARLRNRLQQATANAIGDLTDQEGVAYFETLPGVVPVKNTARCYTCGPVVQTPKNVIQPSATLAMEQDNDDATEFQEIVNDILSAVMPCAMNGFERGPPSVRDAVRGQAEVLGIPRIGCSSNYAWPTAQMNISAAQRDEEDLDLEEELGSRGHVHYDSGDHRGLLSALVANPQLPAGYHPGVFALLYLKVFITLEPFITFFFSGRQVHVGTAPSAPPGVDPSDDALRCLYICYPNGRMLDGMGIYQLVSDPRGSEPMSIPPEIVNYSDADEDVIHTSKATWLHEGARLMEPKSLADFIGHKVLQMAHYYVSRTPEDCGIEIDGESLVKAFRVRGARGQTPYQPSRKGRDLEKREQARRRFKDFVNKHDRFYSSILKTGPRKKKSGKNSVGPQSHAHPNATAVPTQQPVPAHPSPNDEPERIPSPSQHPIHHDDSNDIGGGFPSTRNNHMPAPSQNDGPRRSMSLNLNASRSPSTADDHSLLPTTSAMHIARPCLAAVGETQPTYQPNPPTMQSRAPLSPSHPSSPFPPNKTLDSPGYSTSISRSSAEPMEEDIETRGGAGASQAESSGNSRKRAIPDFALEDQSTAKRHRLEERLYPALKNLRSRDIYAESRSVYREVRLATEDNVPAEYLNLDSTTHALEGLCNRLDEDSGQEAPQLAVQIPPLLSGAEIGAGASALELRRCRLRIMKASRAIVRWLDRVQAQTWDRLKKGTEAPEWLDCLVRETKDMLFYQRSQVDFDPSRPDHQFLAALTRTPFSYRNATRSDTCWPDNDDRTFHQVAMAVQEILRNQLYHSDVDRKEAQGRMVEVLEKSFGEDVLFLDTVWRDYQDFNLKDYLVPKERRSRTNVHIMARKFEAAASSHPILDPSRDASQAYQLFKSILHGNPPNGSDTLGLYDPEFGDLCTLLDAGITYVTGRGEDNLDPAGRRMLERIRSGVNYALPFRQRAPDVARMREEVFKRPIIRTAPGLFSAVLWRSITFDTLFSQRAPTSFANFEAFENAKCHQKSLYPEEAKKKGYFCDINAYGGSAFGRKVENAKGYWDSAVKLEDSWRKLVETTPSFIDCLRFFRPLGEETARFPQLGPLGSYLLTCDLSYGGVCRAPSSGDIATCIYELGKGGLEGLEYLGLASTSRKGDRGGHISEIERGVLAVRDFIKKRYPAQEQEEMVLDFICVEHVLCKLVRHREILMGV